MNNHSPHRPFACALLALIIGAAHFARAAEISPAQQRADHFLSLVNASYQALGYVAQEAQWRAATDVTPAHDAAAETAGKANAAFVGNPALITEAKQLLLLRRDLNDLTVRQLERLLLLAAESPMTNPKLTAARIEAETAQSSTLNSFEFRLRGKTITANEMDNLLNSSTDLAERRAVWEASKESGKALKGGLVKLRDLRNGVAREMGHPDYFSLQVARYGMTTDEMLQLNDDFMRVLRPLYAQLHTWTKYKLAERFKQPVPRLIPAHWINNRWSQEWTGLAEGADLTPFLKDRTPEWIVETAEKFYTSMGFAKMPATFWTKSDLYPVPAGEKRKKNTHASAWHLDLDSDIRSLMSIEPNPQWFTTTHHELGHVYYFMGYTRPEVPPLLRDGANTGFHEGFGELTGLASAQVPYLKSVSVLPADFKADGTAFLLNDALAGGGPPFIFWSAGVMAHWEADIYAKNLPASEWNARWWKYVREFQGVEAPDARGEEFCDAASKTHINDAPAYYFNYAFAQVFKHQLHNHIARKILKQPPQSCNYAGSKEAGDFIRKIMAQGATADWRKILREATGEDLSTRAMLEYYAPLLGWLEKENAGRPIGWSASTAGSKPAKGAALPGLPYLGQPVPGLTPERFAPGLVCTPAVELNGVFSPDGHEFYFTRLIDGIDTMHQIKFADGKWGAPRELLLFPNRVRAEAADMCISADNRELYFLAEFPKAAPGQKPNYDLWVSRRISGEWGVAKLVGPPISTASSELYPVLGADGSLYFNSGRDGTDRIYRALRRPDGGFDQPQKVELAIKGDDGAGDMCLAPDESYLIMTPKLPGGRGRGDLHVSFRQPDAKWSELINLGDRANTAAHEWCPMVTPDGKYLFFSRYFGKDWGDGGDGEVYWVDIRILDQFRPKGGGGGAK